MPIPVTPLFIDGQERPSSTGASFEVRNPYSNEVVGRAAAASSDDCRDAVAAASRAFAAWEQTPPVMRASIFLKAADILETAEYREKHTVAVKDELAAADAIIGGDFMGSIMSIRETAAIIAELKGDNAPSLLAGGYAVVQRRAMGVIFAISPWNAPLALSIRACIVPILCGNTVVLKSSEVTPRTQALAVEAGLPNGVLNLISTAKSEAPARVAEIIAHPAVRKINFTGGPRVGQAIAVEAARHLKPCVLELGGKAAVVVLEDADLETAAKAIVFGALLNSGQICISTERVIVQRSVAAQLLTAVKKQFSELRAGGPGCSLGPLFSEASAEHVVGLIRDAQNAGAEVLLGDGKRDGAVVQPHIVAKVTQDMKLWHNETFGPVVVFVEVDSVDEAVEKANDTEYTLMAALWTENVHTAFNVASRIRAGTININGQSVSSDSRLGGLGGPSGYGRFSVAEFTDTRNLFFHPSKPMIYPL
ncbi:aldehyde dehydrogenase domain-containing protein [Fomitopsis serialis]|uniref:aldehyde dehydrogenase domain-containing protein n=1 Tax=Fomitopsis serialis TaxID=139415 RepID=UPI00200762B5|nr:aldehyde dehydrogenase domain-containing protein [Neoantrodia serialis]KAH9934270.1 aldehyde dehydrogenase domain-containing protein [Neoantrodia serialis]